MLNKANLLEVLSHFSKKRILVVGDLILDVYLQGVVTRISPEAPVPVILHDSEEVRLGGAGNVALNLSRLGAKVSIAGAVGLDKNGTDYLNRLKQEGIDTSLIHVEGNSENKNDQQNNYHTATKTRIISGQQQILRIDREKKPADSKKISDMLIENLNQNLNDLEKLTPDNQSSFDAIIISDYEKGIITEYSFNQINKFAQKHQIYLALDPKEKNFPIYRNLDIMTPNQKEALQNVKNELPLFNENEKITETQIIEVGKVMMKKHRLQKLIITLSARGMALFQKDTVTFIPTFARSVFDVSGAGDTVISTFVLSYIATSDIVKAATIANLAAGVVVSKFGTSTITPTEIVNELNSHENEKYEVKTIKI